MHFDADKYYVKDKKVTLGGRTFDVPIVPAITSLVIARNAEAYKRFGTVDEDEEARKIVFEIIASILNQRISQGKRVGPEWVKDYVDMRIMSDLISYLFSEKEEDTEKKNIAEGGAG